MQQLAMDGDLIGKKNIKNRTASGNLAQQIGKSYYNNYLDGK
jgi:hypothetical protein